MMIGARKAYLDLLQDRDEYIQGRWQPWDRREVSHAASKLQSLDGARQCRLQSLVASEFAVELYEAVTEFHNDVMVQ